MLSEEGRRTLLRLRKKLREIVQINEKMAAGEPVETNQRIKAEAWPQLMEELRRFGTLTMDVQQVLMILWRLHLVRGRASWERMQASLLSQGRLLRGAVALGPSGYGGPRCRCREPQR
ncbi:unnamed protein product [Prorocentrum cordatum]|uniref:Uncharacterized protein n=1 Tax=Prorocentrum cordatum TaxID=2364126 RepID=A0ABN9QUK8_9DINO|nr:unnamed protein product [Polarella glacialis]